MKSLTILVIVVGIIVFETDSYAQIRRLKPEPVLTKRRKQLRGSNESKTFEKLKEGHKKLTELLQRRSSIPIIWEGDAKILTGKVFRGVVLNSIVSTNISSPVLVEALPNQGLPHKTKFSCQATTQNKRVFTMCNKMISREKETSVIVQILNMDGTSGLLGEYDDAKDEMISGAVLSNSSLGLLTGLGSSIGGTNTSASVLQGLVESGKSSSEILLEDMKTKEPVVSVDAGEEVLIYFMEGINEV